MKDEWMGWDEMKDELAFSIAPTFMEAVSIARR